ncbi:MAG: hypothetical protein ACRDZ7_17520 [Acidimicrobiia bacterium]
MASPQIELDLMVDLNTMDDTGLPWAFFDDALHPERLVPGAHIIAGSGVVRAVAQVIDVVDGIVHVRPLRGSVASNAHLLGERPA